MLFRSQLDEARCLGLRARVVGVAVQQDDQRNGGPGSVLQIPGNILVPEEIPPAAEVLLHDAPLDMETVEHDVAHQLERLGAAQVGTFVPCSIVVETVVLGQDLVPSVHEVLGVGHRRAVNIDALDLVQGVLPYTAAGLQGVVGPDIMVDYGLVAAGGIGRYDHGVELGVD